MYSLTAKKLALARGIARLPIEGFEIFVRRSFISEKDCRYLIDLIDTDAQRSKLLGPDPDQEFRTSDTHDFDPKDKIVRKVDERISSIVGIPLSQGEPLQGQRYSIGQQFKPHFDALWGEHLEDPALGAGGQRTWTVMVYLNAPIAGGKTFFPVVGVRITPRAGSMLAWNGLNADDTVNPLSSHQGEPVTEGAKYVLTKWFRQREYRMVPAIPG